ncbi:MAG: PEP-CTERM system histidine kinase PrsK [Desulfuromonadales bacterium]|nr:PEP-CTERM system histidine kinase PrsK [Desulfuromonadales bacterium]
MNLINQLMILLSIIICIFTSLVVILKSINISHKIFLISSLVLVSFLNYTDYFLFKQESFLTIFKKYGLVLEAFTVFLLYFYTKTTFRENSHIFKGYGFWVAVFVSSVLLVYLVVTPLETLIFSPDFTEEKIFFLSKSGFVVYLLLMLFLVYGLVQLERTMAGLHLLQRWSVKLEVVGSGLLLASFALYFSQSLLYRAINLEYLGIRSGAIIVAVSLISYSYLFRQRDRKLALAPGIAHRSFVLLIVAGYLILLGVVGEGLRYLNIASAKPLFLIVLLFGSVGLATVFLSERLRRKLRVLLHKNFYQGKYDYRREWEKFANCVDTGASLQELQQSILQLFCDTLACKGAAMFLYDYDSKHYEQSASCNFANDWPAYSREDALVTVLDQGSWVLNLQEKDSDLDDSTRSILAERNVFLIVPMFFDENLVGFIVLGEQIDPDELLTYQEYDLLRMLARQTISIVHGLRLAEQLSTTRELAAIGKVSTFVLHDLKNQVSGLSLMMDNAREYIADPDFQQDMLETVGNTVNNMKDLIARLQHLKEKPVFETAVVDLADVVKEAVASVGGQIDSSGDSVLVELDRDDIYRVILNLLVNAVEATTTQDAVALTFGERGPSAFVEVTDRGCGMSDDYLRNRLFKPFATTKKQGFGIGLYQCRQIVEAHGGSIFVESQEGSGTSFTVLLPRTLQQ